MASPENDKWLDEALNDTIGSEATGPDFEQWKLQHPEAVEMLTSRSGRQGESPRPLTIRKMIMKNPITKLAAAAAILVALAGLGYVGLSINGTSTLYAATVEALQSVNSIHISGWKTQIHPRHSTVVDAPYDSSKRYKVETWEWYTRTGDYRLHDRQGPITVWDDGNRFHEYHADKDTLYVETTAWQRRPYSEKFLSMTDSLESLRERGIRMTDLGTRTINGRQAKGLETERGNRRYDIWIDAEANLVLENNAYTLKDGQWRQWMHRVISYDQDIPEEISSYMAPKAKTIRYGSEIDPRYEKWNQRLSEILAYYRENPLPEDMEILPREGDPDIWMACYAPGRLPGITEDTGHWVLPLRHTLGDFLQGEFRPRGCLRADEDVRGIQLNHDLITKNEHSPRRRINFVLSTFGFELTEMTEQRKVWVAHYDRRPLKPWREVKAPVPNPNNRPLRPGMAAAIHNPVSARQLFEGFVFYQDQSLAADKIVIVDETGLPSGTQAGMADEKSAIAGVLPFWGGEESIEVARKWFADEFGITFTEETRPMTIYVVRKQRQ